MQNSCRRSRCKSGMPHWYYRHKDDHCMNSWRYLATLLLHKLYNWLNLCYRQCIYSYTQRIMNLTHRQWSQNCMHKCYQTSSYSWPNRKSDSHLSQQHCMLSNYSDREDMCQYHRQRYWCHKCSLCHRFLQHH